MKGKDLEDSIKVAFKYEKPPPALSLLALPPGETSPFDAFLGGLRSAHFQDGKLVGYDLVGSDEQPWWTTVKELS